jgi:hypothetical protein
MWLTSRCPRPKPREQRVRIRRPNKRGDLISQGANSNCFETDKSLAARLQGKWKTDNGTLVTSVGEPRLRRRAG